MLKNIKKIAICLIALFLVVSVSYKTFATGESKSVLEELNEMLQNQNGTIGDNEAIEQIPEGENKNQALNTNTNGALENTNTNTNTNVNENRPETTPHAGLEDYSGLVFVAIFTVSAIYAYKKIREY